MSAFSPQLDEKIKSYLNRYETKRSAILPILHLLQDEFGWVQEEHIDTLEKNYDLHRVHVREVFTFYTAYRKSKPAPYEIQFCNNIVCCMMGANEAIQKIESIIEDYKKRGEEAPFQVTGVPCLGVCDKAPAMLVNKDRHGLVTDKNVGAILEKYAQQKQH